MVKNILVIVANGSEEIETVVFIDLLRRAGANVTLAGENDIIHCSRDIKILPDMPLHKIKDYQLFDLVYLPGGAKGVQNIMELSQVKTILENHLENQKMVATICAAPSILSYFQLLKPGQKITSHPSVREDLVNYDYIEEIIVEENNIISSRGAGTIFQLSFYIIEKLFGNETLENVKRAIVWSD
jgi:DJ-1 family protein